MNVLAALLIAHLVADFPLQSDWMAEHKHESADVLTAHAITHAFVTGVAVLAFGASIPISIVLAILVAFVHGLIDGQDLPIRWDQTAHLAVLLFLWEVTV